jgi:hypothetical protein
LAKTERSGELIERLTCFVRDIREAQDDLHALIGTFDDGLRALLVPDPKRFRGNASLAAGGAPAGSL